MESLPEKLILDTNILISFIKNKGLSRNIILQKRARFFTTDTALNELWDNRQDWNRGKLTETEIIALLDKLPLFVEVLLLKDFSKYIREAYNLMRNIDKDDTPIIAAALYLRAPIWSNDSHFKKQNRVRTYNTEELRKLL
ncbi:MAG: PIN domain-containing protein [Nitrososphaerales archaeon]